MSNPVSLMGFAGMGPEFNLRTRVMGAGELIAEHAIPLYHADHPGLDASQLPLAWNALPDAARKGYCLRAFHNLEDAITAAAALDDQRSVTATLVPAVEARLGDSILDVIVENMKALPRPWQSMTADQQDAVLERATLRVRDAVKDTIRALSTRGHRHIVANLDQITVKKGAKATLSIASSLLDQDLLDAVGQPVMLVLAGDLSEADQIQQPPADPDQRDLLGQVGGDSPAGDGVAIHSDPED